MVISMKKKRAFGLLLLPVFLSGLVFAFLAAWLSGKHMGFYIWPLIACVDLFVFSTAGFFLTEGRQENLYGFCSIFSAVCVMIQLAVLF